MLPVLSSLCFTRFFLSFCACVLCASWVPVMMMMPMNPIGFLQGSYRKPIGLIWFLTRDSRNRACRCENYDHDDDDDADDSFRIPIGFLQEAHRTHFLCFPDFLFNVFPMFVLLRLLCVSCVFPMRFSCFPSFFDVFRMFLDVSSMLFLCFCSYVLLLLVFYVPIVFRVFFIRSSTGPLRYIIMPIVGFLLYDA